MTKVCGDERGMKRGDLVRQLGNGRQLKTA